MALKFMSWMILAALCIGSQAFTVLVLNKSQYPLIPQVQSGGYAGEAPDSVRGYLLAGNERVYDNSDSWLNTPAMAVKEGNVRTMSIFVNAQVVSCGSVTFQHGTIVTYDGSVCATSEMPTATETDRFHIVSEVENFAWIIDEFDTGSEREYATGPISFQWGGSTGKKSKLTFEVVNHSSGKVEDAIVIGHRDTPCGKHYINDAITCSSGNKADLYVEYNEADNPNLTAGSYSGIGKIYGEQWYNAGSVTIDYVNLEITKVSDSDSEESYRSDSDSSEYEESEEYEDTDYEESEESEESEEYEDTDHEESEESS